MREEIDARKNETKVKLYHQVFLLIEGKIKSGEYAVNSKIPSIRDFANDNSISRNTVTKAYKELEKAGYIYSLSKSGFFVRGTQAISVPEKKESGKSRKTVEKKIIVEEKDDGIPTVESILREKNVIDASEVATKPETFVMQDQFTVGPVEVNEMPAPAARHTEKILLNSGDVIERNRSEETKIRSPEEELIISYKNVLHERHNRLTNTHLKSDPFGESSLRVAIAAFLYNFHKINVNPAYIIVGSDMSQLLFNLLSLDELKNSNFKGYGLLKLAEKSIMHENKKTLPVVVAGKTLEDRIYNVFRKVGFTVFKESCDVNGIRIESLEKNNATMVFTNPRDLGDQTLYSRNDNRAQEIFEWAMENDNRYIIDYDTATNFSAQGSIHNPKFSEKVIYLNSFRHLISNYMNACFIVLPKKLFESYREQYKDFGCTLPMLDQMALSDFLIKGKLENYLSNIEQI